MLRLYREASPGIDQSEPFAHHGHDIGCIPPPRARIKRIVRGEADDRWMPIANQLPPKNLHSPGMKTRCDQNNAVNAGPIELLRNRLDFLRRVLVSFGQDANGRRGHSHVREYAPTVRILGSSLDS